MVEMATRYGYDISKPASTAREAVQWTYFTYLAAIKEQNGAAMSVGRISTFPDIYIERDLREGRLTESEAQELIDDLVIKFRIVRFVRTPEYNQLFSGDPTWVTEFIGGIGEDGRTLVTKNSFRILNTLYNLGPAPEPNLTVGWSPRLPEGFRLQMGPASPYPTRAHTPRPSAKCNWHPLPHPARRGFRRRVRMPTETGDTSERTTGSLPRDNGVL
jgi:formate acetyltransferase 1